MSFLILKNKLIFLGPKPNQGLAISLNIPKTLSFELEKLSSKLKIPIFYSDRPILIDEIINIYREINVHLQKNQIRDKHKVLLEQYKAYLIKAILTYLNQCRPPQIKNQTPPIKKDKQIIRWLKIGGLIFLSALSLFQGTVSSLLGAKDLLTTLIPGIGNVWLIVTTLLITAINIILFIAFQMDLLKVRFGVSANNAAKEIIAAHEMQIKHVSQINALITDSSIVSQHTNDEYKPLATLTKEFNNDIEKKKSLYQEYQEHGIKKVLRLGITACGALLFSFSSYFLLASMLATFAPLLVGTPIGWAIIGLFIIPGLIFYFVSQDARMVDMFNSTFSLFNQVKDKLSHFIHKSDHDINFTLHLKKAFTTKDEKTDREMRLNHLDDSISPKKILSSRDAFFSSKKRGLSDLIFVSLHEDRKKSYSI